MPPCTPACLLLWLALPEQACQAVHLDAAWWDRLSPQAASLCTLMLEELGLIAVQPAFDRTYTFLPAGLADSSARQPPVGRQQAAGGERPPAASDGQGGEPTSLMQQACDDSASLAGRWAGKAKLDFRETTGEAPRPSEDACHEVAYRPAQLTSSPAGIWTQHGDGATKCRADFSHQAEVRTGEHTQPACLAGTVDLRVMQVPQSACMVIQQLTATVEWMDQGTTHLYLSCMDVAAVSVTAGKLVPTGGKPRPC